MDDFEKNAAIVDELRLIQEEIGGEVKFVIFYEYVKCNMTLCYDGMRTLTNRETVFENYEDVIDICATDFLEEVLKGAKAEAERRKNGDNPGCKMVSVPLDVIEDVLLYCEDTKLYNDRKTISSYGDFYYKLNELLKEDD